MSMNRFVGLGVFALNASLFVALTACDDSATNPAQVQTYGGAQGTSPGSSSTTPGSDDKDKGTGGTSASSASSSSDKAKGGTTSDSSSAASSKSDGGSKGSSSSDTSEGSKGSSPPAASSSECTADTNLVALAASSEDSSWVGGDPASSEDNPCGVQGAFYAYSDAGLDKDQSATSDNSVQKPELKEGATDEYQSPCSDGKCCISGKTSLWPVEGTTKDYKASVWGGGLGLSLGDPGEGGEKKAYAGSATGFIVTLSGTLAKGIVIRLGYTQSATDESAPFLEVPKVGEHTLGFTDVSCPTWGETCVDPGNTPYDLQVQVVGGDAAGDFEVCIDSIKPIL